MLDGNHVPSLTLSRVIIDITRLAQKVDAHLPLSLRVFVGSQDEYDVRVDISRLSTLTDYSYDEHSGRRPLDCPYVMMFYICMAHCASTMCVYMSLLDSSRQHSTHILPSLSMPCAALSMSLTSDHPFRVQAS
jgi:hypothetical protein